jgi:hypothetical protein
MKAAKRVELFGRATDANGESYDQVHRMRQNAQAGKIS